MNEHPFDRLSFSSGELIFTPCPGTQKTSVNDAVKTLHNAGARAIITLMSNEDLAFNHVINLAECCENLGLTWFHMPIVDNQAPDEIFLKQLDINKTQIITMLNEKQTVAIHCKGGSGRTGLMAAILLLLSGESLTRTFEKVQKIRPRALSKPSHVDFLHHFDSTLNSPTNN